MNRRGGCTKRTKRNKEGFTQDDYTIDMNQNDFNHSHAAAAAVAAGAGAGTAATVVSTEPLSPFDNTRRYAPTPAYGDQYPDYQEGFSQGGYSQEGYSQDGNYQHQAPVGDYQHHDYAHQADYHSQPDYQHQVQPDYGYYDNNAYQPGYDNARHEYYDTPKHFNEATSPTSAGNLNEMNYISDKPNVKDYNSKPNEL